MAKAARLVLVDEAHGEGGRLMNGVSLPQLATPAQDVLETAINLEIRFDLRLLV